MDFRVIKGIFLRKKDVQEIVKEFILLENKENLFKDNIPRDEWYQTFLKRHLQLVKEEAKSITAASSWVSEKNLRRRFLQDSSLNKISLCGYI